MFLLRRVAIPLGVVMVAVTATATAATATPSGSARPGISIHDGAHVQFEEVNGHRSLLVDLDRVDGKTLLDIEYFDVTCDAEQSPRTCNFLFRRSLDVVPTTSRLSLAGAAVTAEFTYEELRRTCVYTPSEEYPGEDNEVCDEEPWIGGRTTTADLTWTGVGEVERDEWRDGEGRLNVTLRRFAQASGTAFGETFPIEESAITQISHSVTYL